MTPATSFAPSAALRHARVQANGIGFHVVSAGERDGRPPCLLLHGFPECWYSWRFQLEALAPRFHAVAFDLRGYGETDKPAHGYELPDLARDAAELIRALGYPRAHVVGHDWGGLIAWELAMRYPEVVDRLVILSAPHPATIVTSYLGNLDQLRRGAYAFFFQLPILPERALSRDDFAAVRRAFCGASHRKEHFGPEDLDALVRGGVGAPGALPCALRYYRRLFPYVLFRSRWLFGPRAVRPILHPTLVLWGDDDAALGPALMDPMPRYAPGVRIEIVPDASHWVQQDRPEIVNRHLLAFLGGDGA